MDKNFVLDQLKNEIAEELGVNLGADTSARLNGQVGGNMTKRLVEMAQSQLDNQNNFH